jgi:hypothetical protein
VSRGKYAAKAANRAAALDNEVIAELRTEVNRLQSLLADARAERDAVLHLSEKTLQDRANAIAAEQIAAARTDCDNTIAEMKKSNAEIARRLENYSKRATGGIDLDLYLDVIAALKGSKSSGILLGVQGSAAAKDRSSRRAVAKLLDKWETDALDTAKTPSHPDAL